MRRISQARLASAADVAKSTLTRFEGQEQGIQLSSALSVLGASGLLDNRWVEFEDDNPKFDWNRDIVTFHGSIEGKNIQFAISQEALEDHFDDRPNIKAINIYNRHKNAIHHVARRIYLTGRGEIEGLFLIRSMDV